MSHIDEFETCQRSQVPHLGSHLLAGALFIILPRVCIAGTSSPVDIGTLILWIVGYLVGFFILSVGAFWSKKVAVTLIFYILGPAVWIAFEVTMQYYRNNAIRAELNASVAASEQTFSQYCKARQRKILVSLQPDSDTQEEHRTVYVRFDRHFMGHQYQYNADVLASYLQKDLARCAKTGVLALEGNFHVAPYKGNARPPEIKRFAACEQGEMDVVPAARARYALVLGESGHKVKLPMGRHGSTWMSRTSVRIVDRQDGGTLAEDTLYFLEYNSGVAGCPKAEEQISELLTAVFGYPKR